MIDVEAVLSATDLLSLVGETVRLKRQGQQHYGLCPFHADKTPTLRVDGKKGLWMCPSCQIGGNAITWLRRRDHIGFREAANSLAQRAGIGSAPKAQQPLHVPQRPKFPLPDREPATPWGGQHLMAGDRPVYVLNDFPGRRRYLDLADRHTGIDFVWYPEPHSWAAEMYLAPIALRPVITEPWPGLWEAYRAAELLDAVAGFRARFKGQISDAAQDHLRIEAIRIVGWIEHFRRERPARPQEAASIPAL